LIWACDDVDVKKEFIENQYLSMCKPTPQCTELPHLVTEVPPATGRTLERTRPSVLTFHLLPSWITGLSRYVSQCVSM
jgi:hypothetical protein